MPGIEFFRQLGLYFRPDFLPQEECRRLMDAMDAAPKRRGVTIGGAGSYRLDQARRSVGDAKIPDAATANIKRSLIDLKPDLERHFAVPLEWGGEGPDYLVYQPGDFFKPHADNVEIPPSPNSRILRRKVAVVLFLNGTSTAQREDFFGGGCLNFYGLLDGPQWKECAFALEPARGLLVAFPSGLVHEVTPITFGARYSILTTFHTPQALSDSSSQ